MRHFTLCLFLTACALPTGKLDIFLSAEDTITEGLSPGEQEEDVRDGWTVSYDKFLIVVGDFAASSTVETKQTLKGSGTTLLDLKQTDSNGVVLAHFPQAAAIRFDRFSYAIKQADALTDVSQVSADDAAFMRANHYALYFEAKMKKASETVRFHWGFAGGTRFGECAAPEGQAGFAVSEGGTASIKPTVHGDHWFFTNNPHTTTPKRLANWIAACDDNHDGNVTTEELVAHTEVGALFPASLGYNLSSLPVQPITNAFQYFAAQARTLGHFNGDGDCPKLEILQRDPREPAGLSVSTD